MICILLIAFGLRAHKLADKNVWLDEGFSVWAARQGPLEAARWTATDVHPPLYFWVLSAWQQAAGEGEFSQRFLSALTGVLTVAAMYATGARLTRSLAGGALAALLMAVSAFAIGWSQEIRMYSLAAWLTCVAMWAAVRLWRTPNWKMWAGYAAAAWGLLMSLYITFAVLAGINLAFAVEYAQTRRKKVVWYWASAQAAAGLAYLPWLAYALPRTPAWSIPTPITPDTFTRFYATLLAAGAADNIERYWLPTVIVWAVLLAGAAWNWRNPPRPLNSQAMLLAILLAWPPALMYAMLLPVFGYARPLAPRYLLIALPAFYVALAWSIVSLRALVSKWTVILAGLAVTAAMLTLPEHYAMRHRSDDYVSTAMALDMLVQPGDAVILNNDQDWPTFAAHYAGHWHGVPNPITVDDRFATEFAAPIWNDSQAVWLVHTPDALRTDPNNALQNWLSGRAQSIAILRFDNMEVGFFARTSERAALGLKPASSAGLRVVNQWLAPGLQLLGYRLPLTVYQTGERVFVFAQWQTHPPLNSGLSTKIELAGADGRVWRATEQPLPANAGQALCIYEIIVDADLPDGWYTVMASADSRPAALGRLRVERKTAMTAAQAPSVRLQVDFARGIQMTGYDLSSALVRPGGWLELRLYWQASEPVPHRYKVFTHLIGQEYNAAQNNFLWGQHDAEPADGAAPFTLWAAGQTIVDAHSIQVHPDSPPGHYQIEIGLYDPITGARVPVLGEQGQAIRDHVILTGVQVR